MKCPALLYPRKCTFCRKVIEEGDICEDCARTLPWTRAGGKTSGSFFSRCVSPLEYREQARRALLRFKFGHRSTYARCFGRLLADCVREQLAGQFEVVTWVPLSLLRRWRRGYSQSRLLAEETAARLGVPCEMLLRRQRHTRAQSSIRGDAARRANVSGAFKPARGAETAGRTILLIDDVVTTGATLSECSRVLLTAGAERVVCAALCRAKRTKPR